VRLLILFFVILDFNLSAQLHFQFTWGKEPIENHKKYQLNEGDWIEFDELKLYLSNYSLSKSNSGVILKLVDLIDNENAESKVILDFVNINSFEDLTFQFGLDSIINTSGILDGDLDPMNGMYWAWNSGYIHLKMVGKSSQVNTAKNQFEYHIGGYRNPNKTYFSVELPLIGKTLKLDLKPLFTETIEFQHESIIMIPSPNAKIIAESVSHLFSIE
jgi:hypothetical protein